MNKPHNSGKPQPPRLADALLKWFCAPHLLEELQGDLHEEFYYQMERKGATHARLHYFREVIGFIRPFAMKRKTNANIPASTLFSQLDTFKNYLTIALRSLWRNKGYAAINSIGLAVAFCICTFLFLTVHFQLSFDSFHQYKDRVFQTHFFGNDPDKAWWGKGMPMPLMPALQAEYGEVEAAARIVNMGKSLIEYKGKSVEKTVMLTDPDFFKLFSFPMIKGNSANALQDLSSIVMSESMATIIFGKEDPLGKIIQLGSEGRQKGYVVTGVIADAPENSSIRYDALIRVENAPNYQSTQNQWDAFFLEVFIKLAPDVNQKEFEDKIKPFTQKYLTTEIKSLLNKGAKPDKRGDVFALRLVKLSDLHMGPEGKKITGIYILLGISFFILLIACFNFINLSIARCFTRAREVGVRKTLGALKSQLFVQIWGESTMLCLLGFVAGIFLTVLLTPQFNAIFGAKLSLVYILQPGVIALLFALFILVTLIAGGYPAWVMSTFNPVEVLKGKVSLKRPGILRNSLIVTQFAMSTLLVCCTIIALQQDTYMREMPLGFDKEQVISIPVGSKINGRQALTRMRSLLASEPTVVSVTGTNVNVGRGKDGATSRSGVSFTYKGKEVATDLLLIDYDYLKTLQIPLLAGREFDPAFPSDSINRVIITQSMADMLDEKEPVGKTFRSDNEPESKGSQIIGVIPDFHLYSLKNELHPITMHLSHTEPIQYIFIRIASGNLAEAMGKMEKAWKEVAPGTEFSGTFLNENVDHWYAEQKKISQLFGIASFTAILLSCAGLFAIAMLVMEQRTKEISIRKVLGADVITIIVLLSKSFIKLILIALAIATPLAWLLMQQWLDEYPYRIEINGWVFAVVGIAAILIALLTISFQSIKVALANPVKSLRAE